MLADFNQAWSSVGRARYDVCVCGTGPAGTIVARKLAAAGKKVLLLEGGGLEYSEASQDVYRGKNIGRTIWLETSRVRQFGGTSNIWTGLCAIQDPISFEAGNTNGLPGWPISREEVLRHLIEAKEIFGIADEDLDTPAREPGLDSPLFGRYVNAQKPPVNFFQKFGNEIENSDRIDAYYNANLVDATLDENSSVVKSIRVASYNGKSIDISADSYVIALGCIENARFLLNCHKQVPEGIGNQTDMVGRCFMEDLNAPIGRFVTTNESFWKTKPHEMGEQILIAPSELLMRKMAINNGALEYLAAPPDSFVLQAGGRLRSVREFVHGASCYWPSLRDAARKYVDFDCPGDGLIRSIIEQEPNPNSRITLTNEVDAFGLRRLQMDWRLTQKDLKTFRVLCIESAKELARLDLARAQLAPFILDSKLDIPVFGHHHHMGATRMSDSPKHGVVDSDCRVHGTKNLYVAGSSVFAKGGGKNPTFTIGLLALRLGEFLGRS